MADQQLIDELKKALTTAPLSPEEQKSWGDVLPVLTDEELRDALTDLKELTKAQETIAKGIHGLQALAVRPPSVTTSEKFLTTAEIQSASYQQLANADFVQEILILARRFILEYAWGSMRELLQVLQKQEEQFPEAMQNTDVRPLYEQIRAELRGIMFVHLTDAERTDLFTRHLKNLLTAPTMDFGHALDLYFLSIGEEQIVGDRHRLFLRILSENGERIGTEKMTLTGKEGTVSPYIKFWILDYLKFVPEKPMRETIDVARYLSEGRNVQRLRKEERELLQKALHLFEYLSYARYGQFHTLPVELEGEEAAPVKLPKGRYPTLAVAPSLSIPLAKETEVSSGDVAERKKSLRQKRVREAMFYDLLAPPHGMRQTTREEFIAGLELLAEENALERAMQDGKIRERFVEYLRTKGDAGLLEGFKLTPTAPKYVRLFLRWVLEDKAKLSESRAAQIAVALANTLRKEGNAKYMEIAYWDQEKNTFVWNR